MSPRLVHVLTVPQSLLFLRGHIRHAQAQGMEVTVIASAGPLLDEVRDTDGVAAVAVEMPRRVSPLHDAVAVARLVRALRTVRPSIVHSHTPKGGLLGMVSAALIRVPVRIYHIRGLPYMTATGLRRRILRSTEWISCRLAHRVLAVSHSIRAVAIEDGVCPSDKIRVLLGGSGNGVDAIGQFDPHRWSPAARAAARAERGIEAHDVVIGFVGRIVRDKGIVELATAWQGLSAGRADVRLLLVGPLEAQDPVPDEVLSRLRADPRVDLVGDVPNPADAYALMDVVVLPTYREGFPNVPLEAAAMGLPVVATAIPGCVDAVDDGVTGTLVPPRDAVALERALSAYVSDPTRREREGRAGRARVLEQFGQVAIWEAQYDQYVELLGRS